MVTVRVADEKDLDVAEVKAELLDTRLNQRNIFVKTAIY
jgi:hypothetical protein